MSLSPPDSIALDTALARVRAAADAADAAVAQTQTVASGLTSWVLGDGSAIAAASENARQTRVGYNLEASRIQGIKDSGTHDDVASFVSNCGAYCDVSDIVLVATQNQPATVVKTVAVQTAQQVSKAAGWAALGFLPLALIAIAIYAFAGGLGRGAVGGK